MSCTGDPLFGSKCVKGMGLFGKLQALTTVVKCSTDVLRTTDGTAAIDVLHMKVQPTESLCLYNFQLMTGNCSMSKAQSVPLTCRLTRIM